MRPAVDAPPPAPPAPYIPPRLTHQGSWQTVTLFISLPVGPGNFGLPGTDAPGNGGS
ncbi:hypothetical protein GCM10008957_55240 [Deinococcus ruber]|uniref:Uncharacterized protein n=1 Tax=Deinococcus ruber TaxID=1848197 RepID=A0A918FIG3_9DEIO|nr:hypothetical protein GCM10008957_55240 [Deinococcus ruber]